MIFVKMVLKILSNWDIMIGIGSVKWDFVVVREMELNSKCKEKWEFTTKRQKRGGQQREND